MRVLLAAALLTTACGGSKAHSSTGTGGGGSSSTGTGGELPSPRCPEGQTPQSDGACAPAGVTDCGAHFMPDEEGGCVAILPPSTCPEGTMAIPGETECRPVADCGDAIYPSVPAGEPVEHVDQSYAGGDSDGSDGKPWTTVVDAAIAAADGSYIAVAAGSYAETVSLNSKVLHLVGRCPDLVTIGAGQEDGLIVGHPNDMGEADGTTVTSLAITALDDAVLISNVQDVVFDQVWLHDAPGTGLLSGNEWGPVSYTVRASLVENNGIGVLATDSRATVEDSVIRGSDTPTSLNDRGLSGEHIDGEDHQLTVRRSLIENNRSLGLGILETSALVEDVVVRSTLPDEAGRGRGVVVQNGPAAPADATLRRLIVRDSRAVAVTVQGSTADLSDVVITDTTVDAAGLSAVGLQIQYDPVTQLGAEVTVARSLVARAEQGGIGVISARASFDRVIVRDITQTPEGLFGLGLSIVFDINQPVENVVPSQATILGSIVESTHVAAVSVAGSSLSLEQSRIDGVAASEAGEFGDGLVLLGDLTDASAVVSAIEIDGAARAGIANFGGAVEVGESLFTCNGIHLDGEFDYAFTDHGGNSCGCDSVVEQCKVLSSNLKPPSQGL